MNTKSDNQRRSNQRFHSVGIACLYSPAAGGYLDGVGQMIVKAALHDMSLTGLSFDVTEALGVGSLLYVEVQQEDQGIECFRTEVCWCEALPERGYRVGVKILDSEEVEKNSCDVCEAVSLIGNDFPATLDISCPACNQAANFRFVSSQGDLGGGASMPLYNCSECGTTRSLASMLIQQRRALLSSNKK